MFDKAGRVVVAAVVLAIGFAGRDTPAPQAIEMGVVEAAAHEGGGGRDVVVGLTGR